MISSVRDVIDDSDKCTFYHAIIAAIAKVSLGYVQINKILENNKYYNINTTLTDVTAFLKFLSSFIAKGNPENVVKDRSWNSLGESIYTFRISAKKLFELVSVKVKQSLKNSIKEADPFRTPPRPSELITPKDFGDWNSVMENIINVLTSCAEILSQTFLQFPLPVTKTEQQKRTIKLDNIILSYIDIMILLGKIHFNVSNDNTHEQAYEYLSAAEQLCSEAKYSEGYKYISTAYFDLGAAMISNEQFNHAEYPLRKACSLLERDTEHVKSPEGKLQLCKTYQFLGNCCQKNKRSDESIKSYRLALQRIPLVTIKSFVKKSNSTAVSTLVEHEPLVSQLMDRFLRASITNPLDKVKFACEWINMTTLNHIEQCIFYECELRLWNSLSLKMDVYRFQSHIIEKLLEIYDSQVYPIRRAR
ncbi:hypothetical protein BDB01DRAFT_719302 [Pilobolus umbonatus]|nr:hypothetical protein BDB01DRAFT_719302 [Pilobolus umbonatus]